jgi:hypothetical protein
MIDEANAGTGTGGLLDVSGLTIEDLSAAVSKYDLGRALDHILLASDNSAGFHGFNNCI